MGRVVLAAVLFGSAGFLLHWWPRTALWSIPATNVLGIDTTRGLLLTTDECAAGPPPVSEPLVVRYSVVGEVRVRAWDLSTGQIRSVTKIGNKTRETGASSYGMALGPGGNLLALWRGDDSAVEIYEAATGRPLQRLQAPCSDPLPEVGPISGVRSMAFSSDGSLVVAASYDRVTVWSVKSGTMLQELSVPQGPMRVAYSGTTSVEPGAIDFSPDARFVAITSVTYEVRVYEVLTGRLMGTEQYVAQPRFLSASRLAARSLSPFRAFRVFEVEETGLRDLGLGMREDESLASAGPTGLVTTSGGDQGGIGARLDAGMGRELVIQFARPATHTL